MRMINGMKIVAVAALLSLSAIADHGGRNNNNNNNNDNNQNQRSFESALVGSVPATTIGGVVSGGLPWVVQSSEASLSAGGRLQVEVKGLLLAPSAGALAGTVGPVQMVAASLVCGGSGGMVAASTGGVMLTAGGNAEMQATITAPTVCMAPVILVRIFNPTAMPGSELGPFIAVSGIDNSMQNAGQNNNGNGDGN